MRIFDVGLTGYKETHLLQEQVWEQVRQGAYPAGLILCRHTPVITFGRRAKRENVSASAGELAKAGIELFDAERGGDVTYHGPGQLIAYPVCDLSRFKKDVHRYLRFLEEVVLSVLADFGIAGQRKEGLTGVWIGDEKISSIGVGIRHWVTWHGLSLNIKMDDLLNFSFIRPCGMDIRMTSMEAILGRNIMIEDVKRTFIERFINATQTLKEGA